MAGLGRPLRVWSLTTGEAGTRQQAWGLARAISDTARERQVSVSRLWALAPGLMSLDGGVAAADGPLSPPWPDLLVTCGRRSALVSREIRRRNPEPMVTVHIQPPPDLKAFDLVVALPHDRLSGRNVLVADAALHGIRPADLRAAARDGHPSFVGLPPPWTGVLVGGAMTHRSFSAEDAARLVEALDELRGRIGGSLLITPSRRTPEPVLEVLRRRYGGDPAARLWDGRPPNPYLPILALCERLVVTGDSISMISEALATSAPVMVFEPRDLGARRGAFVAHLRARGLVRAIDDPAANHPRLPIDATAAAAEATRRLLAERLGRVAA